MTTDYAPLRSNHLAKGATFHRPMQVLPERVELDYPATYVMTDLKQVTAITVEPDKSIDAASRKMIKNRVRLLFVVDEHGTVLGLITATDILGEKPLQFIQKSGWKREDILVGDIMTPQERLEVLCMEDIASAKVGNVVATLEKSGRQHALVVDREGPGQTQVVRGIFSASQIARQLGTEIQTFEVAQTFAEIQVRLSQ